MPIGSSVARRGAVYELTEPERLIVKQHGIKSTRRARGRLEFTRSGVLVAYPNGSCQVIDAARLIRYDDAVVAWRDRVPLVDDKVRALHAARAKRKL